MKIRSIAILIGGVCAWTLSCSSGGLRTAEEQKRPSSLPTAVVVQRVLSGRVLGASIASPTGVTVSNDKRIYLSDTKNNRVLMLDSAFNPIQQTGGYGVGSGQLSDPRYLTLDNNLNLIVADAGNRRLSLFNSRLDFVSTIKLVDPNDPLKFGAPSGVAVGRSGEVWLSEPDNNRLAIFSYAGVFDRFIADYNESMDGVVNPQEVLAVGSGRYMVCDAGHQRVMTLDEFGISRRQIRSGQFKKPVAAAVDDDLVWVVDEQMNAIYLFTADGSYLLMVGPGITGTPVLLKHPSDIAVLSKDHILIVDSGNDRLLLCRVFWSEESPKNELSG